MAFDRKAYMLIYNKKYREENKDRLAQRRRDRYPLSADRRYKALVWKKMNHGRVKATKRACWLRRKIRIISAYGGKCTRCGFTDERALQLDHVDGGGRAHFKQFKSPASLYTWVERNNYPKSLQILCANCNSIKRFEVLRDSR